MEVFSLENILGLRLCSPVCSSARKLVSKHPAWKQWSFWSLSYEFFYYMIFGTVALLPTLKSKILVGLTFCIIAGPKILILFPCWLMGCLSYWGCKKFRLNSVVSLVLLLLCGFSLYSILGPRWSSWTPNDFPGLGVAPLFTLQSFLDDYILAVLIGGISHFCIPLVYLRCEGIRANFLFHSCTQNVPFLCMPSTFL